MDVKNFGKKIMKHMPYMTRGECKTLAYLMKHKDYVTSRQIEHDMDLRQPEVSMAIKQLKHRKWITIKTKDNNHTKGRPISFYKLKKPAEEIMDSMIHEIEETMEQYQEHINYLLMLKESEL